MAARNAAGAEHRFREPPAGRDGNRHQRSARDESGAGARHARRIRQRIPAKLGERRSRRRPAPVLHRMGERTRPLSGAARRSPALWHRRDERLEELGVCAGRNTLHAAAGHRRRPADAAPCASAVLGGARARRLARRADGRRSVSAPARHHRSAAEFERLRVAQGRLRRIRAGAVELRRGRRGRHPGLVQRPRVGARPEPGRDPFSARAWADRPAAGVHRLHARHQRVAPPAR